jgi:RNA polymerase sigma factor (sigma-70 family)
MPNQIPPEVLALWGAGAPASRDAAWERFVAIHTRLLLHVARSLVHDHDLAMDAYVWLLERLREDDARRLRGFAEGGRSKFTTWLVVVSRRMCVDFLRHRGGRPRPELNGTDPARDGTALRKRLLFLAGDKVDLETIRDLRSTPAEALDRVEVRDALAAALRELPAADQLLLSLRFNDGMEAADIARAMEFPSRFHVYRRLDRVLHQLRSQLLGKGIDASS